MLRLISITFLLVLFGCVGQAQPIPTQTPTTPPTATPSPTDTATVTPTPTQTDTPAPTKTRRPTNTPTAEPTLEPTPTPVTPATGWQVKPLTAIFATLDEHWAAPVVGDVELVEQFLYVYVRNVIYVLDAERDTIVYELTLPASTESVGSIPEHYNFLFGELLRVDNLLYAFDDAIHIIDLSNPVEPRLLNSTEPVGHHSSRAHLIDGWLVLADIDFLHVYDISQPQAPRQVSSLEFGADFGIGIFAVTPITTAQGRFLLVTVGLRSILADDVRSGLAVVDFNDPANLFEAVTLDKSVLGYVSQIAQVGERLYVNEYADDAAWLHEITVADIAAPTIVQTPLTGYAFRPLVAHQDSLLFLHRHSTCAVCLYLFDGVQVRELPLTDERTFWGTNGHSQRVTVISAENSIIVGGEAQLFYITR